jgi:hypothetical protein
MALLPGLGETAAVAEPVPVVTSGNIPPRGGGSNRILLCSPHIGGGFKFWKPDGNPGRFEKMQADARLRKWFPGPPRAAAPVR